MVSHSPVWRVFLVSVGATASLSCPSAHLDAALEAARQVEDVVRTLAADGFDGRDNLRAGSLAAQEYLIDRLTELGEGFDPLQPGEAAYRQPFAQGTNLLAVIPGRELPDEYVLVGAHYDHLSFCAFEPGSDSSVCNGAQDNAAGVAAVLAIGRAMRALPTPPRRSVMLALWDAEEDGLIGSEFFAAQEAVGLESIVAYVNFDTLGANLLPGLRRRSFAVGAETGGPVLQRIVADAVAAQELQTVPLSVVFGQNRSDHASFYLRGVPSVFFTDATGGCYHTSGDEIEVVDFSKLAEQSQIGFRTVLALAEGDERPETPPTQPPLLTYEDVAGIADVITGTLPDLDLFPSFLRSRILEIEAFLRERADAGPAAFDPSETFDILFEVADAVEILSFAPCDAFLDTDADGVLDIGDNCTELPNASQSDADEDGFGDACDGDFDQDGFVGDSDFAIFLGCFNTEVESGGGPAEDPTCAESDMNADGFVGGPDFTLFLEGFNGPPGPSGTARGPATPFQLSPCAATDSWEFEVGAGERVFLEVDTVDATTAADLCFSGTCPGDSFFGDDDFPCAFPPPAFSCPRAGFVASAGGTCTVQVRTCSSACADPEIANYVLTVERDGSPADPTLVEDDP